MPHPTPYSREFETIREKFPGLFDRTSEDRPLMESEANDAKQMRVASIIHFHLRRSGRGRLAQRSPAGIGMS